MEVELRCRKLTATVHLKLLDLLKLDDFNAFYLPSLIKNKDELLTPKKPTQSFIRISKSYWRFKVLPHYDYSAIHFGESNKLYFTKHVLSEGSSGDHEIEPEYQFWFGNVQIEAEAFKKYILPSIYRYFPVPEKAILKPKGNNYLIDFGQDKGVEVKGSFGLHTLKILIQNSNSNGRHQEPIPSESLELLSKKLKEGTLLTALLVKTFKDDDWEGTSSSTSNNDVKKTKKNIRTAISKTRKKVEEYWRFIEVNNAKSHDESIINTKNELKETILMMAEDIYSPDDIRVKENENDKCYFYYKENVKGLLKENVNIDKRKELLDFSLPHSSVESKITNDSEGEELTLMLWNRIKSGMDKIEPSCPQLYFHLYGSNRVNGFKGALKMEGDGLIYQPTESICWDLGER